MPEKKDDKKPAPKATKAPAAKKVAAPKQEQVQLDAAGKAIGRLATEVATHLRGKHLVSFQPHVDPKVQVFVKNAGQLKISDAKLDSKVYYRHSEYPGGLKETGLRELFDRDPAEVIRKAVYNMLPKNKLRAPMMKRLKIER